VAIYHLSVKSVSRGEGRSGTSAAAYRAADLVHDDVTDQVFDYTRKRGVEHSEIILSSRAAQQDINWPRNRQDLWNAAEKAEKRKDARIAREYELALPTEMTRKQRLALTREFALQLADRYQCAVDVAIHRPHWNGDQRNHHAHLLATTREITPTGLGAKTSVEWSNTDRRKHGLQSASLEMTEIRARWAGLVNEHLQELGIDAAIDHRSLKAQGIEREPTVHLGPAVRGMQQRGVETEVGFRIAEQARERLERAYELGVLERQSRALSDSMLVLDQDLRGALKAREAVLAHGMKGAGQSGHQGSGLVTEFTLEAVQRQARERWRELRSERLVGEGSELKPSPELELGQGKGSTKMPAPKREQRLEHGGLEDDFSI
jgi:ATP-dependent exoDNAse (exonuclease V) alpha subunit